MIDRAAPARGPGADGLPRAWATLAWFAATVGLAPAPANSRDAAAPCVRVPILMYHHIRHPRPDETRREVREMIVEPAAFASQVAWLRREGYTSLTARQLGLALAGRIPLPAKPVVLTFDDGWSCAAAAAAVLDEHGFRGTFFVYTDVLGDRRRLSWRQARVLIDGGHEIGSHTLSHALLPALPEADARRELGASRRAIQDRLGTMVHSFAYPYGGHSPALRAAVAEAGYAVAVGTDPGVEHHALSPYALTRLRVGFGDPLEVFVQKVQSAGE